MDYIRYNFISLCLFVFSSLVSPSFSACFIRLLLADAHCSPDDDDNAAAAAAATIAPHHIFPDASKNFLFFLS